MVDMVDYKALRYAVQKREERVFFSAAIDYAIKNAKLDAIGLMMLTAARAAADQKTQEYECALSTFMAEKRKLHFQIATKRNLLRGHKEGAMAAHYYKALFHATEGRKMLDRWDAENAKLRKAHG